MSGKYQIFDVMSTEMEIHLRLSKPSDMLKKIKYKLVKILTFTIFCKPIMFVLNVKNEKKYLSA